MKSAGFYDLRQAFTEPGCALCQLLQKHGDGFIDATLWELVNDDDGRAELDKARGYCNQHAWMLVRYGASLSSAILMNSVIGATLRIIEKEGFEGQSAFSLRQMLSTLNASQPSAATAKLTEALAPQIPCPVCVAVEKSEAYYVAALIKHLTGPDNLAEAYEASDGLCLPHFRLTLAGISDEETFNILVEAQKKIWLKLRSHLKEFIRKKDHRFKHEKIGIEGDSWLRGIEAVSGARPWKHDKNKL